MAEDVFAFMDSFWLFMPCEEAFSTIQFNFQNHCLINMEECDFSAQNIGHQIACGERAEHIANFVVQFLEELFSTTIPNIVSQSLNGINLLREIVEKDKHNTYLSDKVVNRILHLCGQFNNFDKMATLESIDSQIPIPSCVPIISNSQINIVDILPNIFAQNITYYFHLILKSMRPNEFCHLSWTRPESKLLSPHIIQLIDCFNYGSRWFTLKILQEPNVLLRAKLIEHTIFILCSLFELRNYHGTVKFHLFYISNCLYLRGYDGILCGFSGIDHTIEADLGSRR